ncbi:MAG: LacI family DNA-binding transcriptional regulator [Lacisediminihabitans sp.]
MRSSSRKASVTLKDVAARVGVTSASVSMALADSPRISEKTKEAVRAAALELGYVPSSAGRALRNQRSEAVAVIVPNTSQHVFGHSYFMHVLTGVSAAANARDMQVVLSTTAEEAGDVAAYERVVRSRSADGAIVTSAAVTDTSLEALVASGLPVVLIGNFPYLPSAITVGIDDVDASRQITEHLLVVHGVKRVLYVTGPLDHQTGIDRRIGFEDAIKGRSGVTAQVIEGDFSEDAGRRAVETMLNADAHFEGIIFANDDMAFGGMQALRSAGLRVPEDVALVGFDDFGLARLTNPGITTVHVPAEDLARLATEQLLRIIDNVPLEPARQQLPVSITVRESCGCTSHPNTTNSAIT